MASSSKIEFVRGDGATHYLSIPADAWTAGGKLFFTAKSAIDDDLSDASAVISGEFDDTNVADVTVNDVAYKKYTCFFPPSATSSIVSNGETSRDYIGEFQYVPTTGVPVTLPPTAKIKVKVWFDVTRKTT